MVLLPTESQWEGFTGSLDKHNTAIHEFCVTPVQDGAIDGLLNPPPTSLHAPI